MQIGLLGGGLTSVTGWWGEKQYMHTLVLRGSSRKECHVSKGQEEGRTDYKEHRKRR